MEQVTTSTGAYSWNTLLIAQFSLAYDLESVKVQGELREKLRSCRGAKGITVEPVQNRYRYMYRVMFPNQTIDGIAITVEMIRGALEELEEEVREAIRVKECLGMIQKEE